ncbi:Asparagine synthetase domain-containing protein C4F6.11c [Neonectria ditissima]|uniref:Asparagine synthetase domain-containing protein C4F6.11c n=1 Tax=Neonectria ditissima TaxID=78410 RepID=A0A0P7BRK1_9HYPO|nr:Asparagine synthetase domain-containing protein C4F6.11c [Neonectria ditissima]
MCGIHAAISSSPNSSISAELIQCLAKRGPDHTGTAQTQVVCRDPDRGSLFLTFTSTVLSLRGDHVAKQPLVDDASGSILCWNGEAWGIRGEPVRGNDGEAALALLTEASRSAADSGGVLDALRAIEGPFAFFYFDKPAKRLYYGRDRLGRRSLLVKAGLPFALSSVADMPVEGWTEVEADGCYALELSEGDLPTDMVPTRYDWSHDPSLVSGIGVFNSEIPEVPYKLTLTSTPVQALQQHLISSLRLRVLDVPLPPEASDADARIAVLFSGGLDCTVLARLSDGLVPPEQSIDLINVAFENPRIGAQHPDCSRDDLYEKCPDRMTGRSAFAELSKVCPSRAWRFLAVNVPYTETLERRPEIVRLIYPHNTEMDLSIGCALYFAARGQGLSETRLKPEPQAYNTTARVLLSGLGADELFGGYVRHATAYSRRGYHGVVEELKLDVGRLGKRNLGRDDRVMSHWGREVRFPYLDERFVKWAIESAVSEKCDFENEQNEDDVDAEKRVVRLLAKSLGMDTVSREKKRAVSAFGISRWYRVLGLC